MVGYLAGFERLAEPGKIGAKTGLLTRACRAAVAPIRSPEVSAADRLAAGR